MFWQILVDPAILMDAAIKEEIAAEAGQPVLHVDYMGKWELLRRYSSWIRLVRMTICIRRVILILTRLSNSFSEEVECVDGKRTDSEVRRVKSIER